MKRPGKPHITRACLKGGFVSAWVCHDERGHGRGDTPASAYGDYLCSRQARQHVERLLCRPAPRLPWGEVSGNAWVR